MMDNFRAKEIARLRAGLTDYGLEAVVYWMAKTGCSELMALRHVSGGPKCCQPNHVFGKGWW